MKSLVSFSLLILSLSAQANLCTSHNGLVQNWRSQKSWQNTSVSTSNTNKGLTFEALVTDKDQILLKPFEVVQNYKSEMAIEIDEHYSREKYIGICKQDLRKGRRLSMARARGSQNVFRLPVSLFPGKTQSLDLKNQDLKISDLGVRLVFRNGSMVEDNLGFLSNLSETKRQLESIINRRLEDSTDDLLTEGGIEINLDGLDDLACDLMKGRVEVELYSFVNMTDPEVRQVEGVDEYSVSSLYQGLRSVEEPTLSAKQAIFSAGRVYENLKMIGQVNLPKSVSAFQITQDMFAPDFVSIKELGNKELTCLAENYSKFEQEKVESSIILNVKSQQIYELKEEL